MSDKREKPKEGDKIYKTKIAFLPTKVNGRWLWFKKYVAEYTYNYKWERHEEIVSSGLFTEKVQVWWHKIGRFRLTNKDLLT